jgi:hypothetical protein
MILMFYFWKPANIVLGCCKFEAVKKLMFAVPIFVMVNRKVVDSQGDCGNNWTEDYGGEVLFLNSFSY